jgi:GT2 family glycosyltransferase
MGDVLISSEKAFEANRMTSVACVVVTYYGELWLRRCLESLRNSSVPIHIIVVDNGSGDQTVEIAKSFAGVEVIELATNQGFARANNMGMQQALRQNVDALFLLNQDAWVDGETIATLLQVACAHPEYGILSPVHLTQAGDALDPNFQQNFTAKSLLFDLLHKRPQALYAVSFTNAAAWLLPRKTLETVGGFDPLFFMYGEDNDYCVRVLAHARKIGVVPHTFIYHARAKVTPPHQTARVQLATKSQQLYSILLFSLKRIDRPFYRTIPATLYQLLEMLLRRLFAFDLLGVGACLIAAFDLMRNFRQIVRHRKFSRQGGMLWLNSGEPH